MLKGRVDRVGCLVAEQELERIKKKTEDDGALPIILEVLGHYPGAREELIKKLEGLDLPPPAMIRDAAMDATTMSDDELEERVRAILARRDRERAEGKR